MMGKRDKLVFFVFGIIILSVNFVQAVELLEEGKIIIPDRTSEVIKINGDLSEDAWSNAPISENFLTYSPVRGEVLKQKTIVWLAYDSRNLYFAFKCYDNEPDKIKTSISKRDNMLRDDWIGVLLDAMGSKQTSYEFYVNPSGIQADYLNSAVKGLDKSPDFVWESAGKLTGDGYQVEICIPLKSIRHKSGKKARMGVLFLRSISRLGTIAAWPELKAGQTDFNCMTTVTYKDIKKSLKLEVLPNFTYSRNKERENADTWGKSDISKNIGASLKYGITSSVIVEATINPDFSQVESDAFQVDVNQRYPIFYSEKRPFFMEGMDVLDFGKIKHGMMISTVHTRRIVDPAWAAKLSGSMGKMNFAVLTANDRAAAQTRGVNVNPNNGEDTLWTIARCKYNLGHDNTLGILYSGCHLAGNQNNVAGIDFLYRFFNNARLSVSYLHSRTEEPTARQVLKGNGFNAMLQFVNRELDTYAAYERYDNNFAMYSAFLNRTDISRGIIYISPYFYPKIKKIPWILSINPYIQYWKLHDLGTGMDDMSWKVGFKLKTTRWGEFWFRYNNEKEAWQGQLFHQKYLDCFGMAQIFKWLFIDYNYRYGDQLYYDLENPFLGTGNQVKLGFIFQPNIRLSMNIEFIHNDLYEKKDRQKVYDVDIINLYTTYQFNKYFFIRGAVRYDDFEKRLLTDFLASFTLIPGTVMHLGYGSLYERRVWQNNRWIPGQGDLLNIKNSLFFKISYLWRIK